jgi:ABC-2 type transport system permease protein
MLWYKSWLDTRWRFLIGLGVLLLSAATVVLAYPQVVKLLPLVPAIDTGNGLGRRIKEAAELTRSFDGYVWLQWFRQNLCQTWTLFAVLIGSGGLLSQGSSSAALFTLSLPVSRARLLAVRAGTGLVELLLLAIVPSLLIPLVAPGIGQHYPTGSVFVHGVCLFVAGSMFFSLATLLSTEFDDVWRPMLLTLAAALAWAVAEQRLPGLSRIGLFALMSGEGYFRAGAWPWLGLISSAAASIGLLYAAALNFGRHDF